MIKGIKVSNFEEVAHTLFVDNVLVFGEGTINNLGDFANLLDKYKKSMGMVINIDKSNLVHNEFSTYMLQREKEIVPYKTIQNETGFKYLGFFIKPNSYSFQDWVWLYKKIESRISSWENRFLSRGGRLVLLKVVL